MASFPEPPLLLTDDQAHALALHLGRAFPPWRIWRAADTWYATGPCRIPECVCSRTLHAPGPADLCQQLAEVEQAEREQRGDGALSNEAAFLLGEAQFSDEAAQLAERQLKALQQEFPGWDITCVADLSTPVWYAVLRTAPTDRQKVAGVLAKLIRFSAEALATALATQVERVHRARAIHTFGAGC
ncbi:hypothetical protein GCM10022252_08710 [Streptosporangium oxazolinicum]|uniref:Uncharacterized protein n=1 Tax=Streptosporangium oxazolinicum TaxID=909287 RepID=A0ABP8AEF6_9ACTN